MKWSKLGTRFWTASKHCLVGGFTVGAVLTGIGLLDPESRENHFIAKCSEKNSKWDFNWDRRQPESLVKPLKPNCTDEDKANFADKLKKKEAKVSRHIILVRHGHYNIDGSTDKERILTEQGRTQAEHTARRLKELSLPFDGIVSSTMSRAKETAEIIREQFPSVSYTETDLLCEGAPIEPEPPSLYWKPDPQDFFVDGARIEAAFRRYIHRADYDQEKDSYEILVCHGNVIRYFVCRALQVSPEAWLRMNLDHASITWLSIRPTGRLHVKCLGSSGHMPANLTSA